MQELSTLRGTRRGCGCWVGGCAGLTAGGVAGGGQRTSAAGRAAHTRVLVPGVLPAPRIHPEAPGEARLWGQCRGTGQLHEGGCRRALCQGRGEERAQSLRKVSSTCSRRLGGGWAVGIGVGRDLLSLPEPTESGLARGSQWLGRDPSVEPETERLLVRAHHLLILGRSLEELTPPPGTALPVWMLHAAASYPGTLCQGLSLGWGPLRAAAPSPKRPGGCERQGLLSQHQRARGAGALMGFPWQAWARPPGLPLW